jgi:hypothetical protein
MSFVYLREYLNAGDVVVVQCSHQCNVRVMDDANFYRYKSGASHNYHGGHYKMLPARVRVPSSGYWTTTIDLGGSNDRFEYSIGYLKTAAA